MKDILQKSILLTLLTFCAIFIKAQYIIIKNDSTKIQSKVIEITETTISYKMWENQDGPLYNIALNEANMILSANGQKEIVNPSNAIDSVEVVVSGQFYQTNKNKDNIAIDYKTEKVRYKPNRLNIELQSLQNYSEDKDFKRLSFGGDKELRIVKNVFNLGLGTYIYSLPENEIMPYSYFFNLYGSFYAPVNRLLKKYEKQNKGLFMFAHTGYGYDLTWTVELDEFEELEEPKLISKGGFVWRLGMDYFIVKGFGFTVSTYEFKTYYAGIVFSFN